MLRGGSFNNNQNNARAAYRNMNNPNNRNRNNGFRVGVGVAAHPSRGSAGIVARLRLGVRGFERKRGLSLAAPAPCEYARS